jgi:hypothetical protein
MRGIVSVTMANGDRRRVKLNDCAEVLVLQEPSGLIFARVPKLCPRPVDDDSDWVDVGVNAEKVPELLRKQPARRNRKPAQRDQGKTAECLRLIKEDFRDRWSDGGPSPTELAKKCVHGSRNPAYKAYEIFYESREYREYREAGGESWGHGRPPMQK